MSIQRETKRNSLGRPTAPTLTNHTHAHFMKELSRRFRMQKGSGRGYVIGGVQHPRSKPKAES